MGLNLTQQNYIQDQYERLKNDNQTLGELCEIIVDHCIDELHIVDLSDDNNGDMFDVFYDDVWDFLETLNR